VSSEKKRTIREPELSTQVAAKRQPIAEYPVISSPPIHCRLQTNLLIVPPFRLIHRHEAYISATETRIDLTQIAPGRYRILAVHNFHVEDRNPRLDECVAGVFLATLRNDGSWEEAERFPVECRAIAMLGELEIPPQDRHGMAE
jgi:hypothetical protein